MRPAAPHRCRVTRPPRRPQHQQQVPPPLPTPGAGAGLSSPLRSPRRPPPPSPAAAPAVAALPTRVPSVPRAAPSLQQRLGEPGGWGGVGPSTVAAATGGSDALTDRCSARGPPPPALPRGHVLRGGEGSLAAAGRGGAEGNRRLPQGGGETGRRRPVGPGREKPPQERGMAAGGGLAGRPDLSRAGGAAVRYGPGLRGASTTATPHPGTTSNNPGVNYFSSCS